MKIKLYRNPFDMEDFECVEIPENEVLYKSVKDHFKEHFPKEVFSSYICTVSGGSVESDYAPAKDAEILFVRSMSGGKSGGIFQTIIGTALIIAGYMLSTTYPVLSPMMISAGLSLVAGGLSSFFAPTSTASDLRSSATYSWGGIQNIIGEGSTSVIVYGEHRVGGVVIEGYVDGLNDNGVSDKNFLYLMTMVSEGPVQQVIEETALINGKSIWMYSDTEDSIEQFYNPKTNTTETVDGVIINSRAFIEAEYKLRNPYLGDNNGNDGKADPGGRNAGSDDGDSGNSGNSGFGR